MLKNLLLIVFCILIIFAANSQQQPENSSFEDWEDVGLDENEPIEWSSIKTSDGGYWVNLFAPYVWEQSNDAHSGSHSVRLYNNDALGIVAAGTVTNGRIHAETTGEGWAYTDLTDSGWNTPITSKPDSVVIWAKFSPSGSDVAQVKALLHTGSAKIPDPTQENYIAMAELYIPDQTNTWTRFSAHFNYFNSIDPEYILFVVSSGDEVATLGSEAWYDDIELIYNPAVLDLTIFLEGAYVGNNQMHTLLNPDYIFLAQPYNTNPWNYYGDELVFPIPNTDIVDWVLVELRVAPTAAEADESTIIERRAGFLLSDGSIVDIDGSSKLSFESIVSNNLFVVVKHRNHLGIMSADHLVKTDGYYSYNFSNDETKIYGGASGCKQLETSGPEVWGMIGGDGDANGIVNSDDKLSFWSIFAGKSGYISGDYNMDGELNNPDKNDIWLNNISKESQVPN